MANNPVVNMFKVKELRSKLLFTLLILAVFRLGSVLTIPGINATLLLQYFDNLASGAESAFASYMDFFAGGAFERFSVFMLGVMPYISTQIIMQLALVIFPSLKRIAQEEGGQQKVQGWTRVGTIIVCLIQSMAITVYADSINQQIPGAIIFDNKVYFNLLAILTVTTGSMITVWMGNQITARGIGNGISMIIFAGIVARLPSAVYELIRGVRNEDINVVFVVVAVFLFLAAFLTFPLQIANSLSTKATWLMKVAAVLNPLGFWYNFIEVLLIVFFAYFYTQVTLNPTEIAKNIRENGGSIPGIRTDKTEEYLQKVLNRLILPGSLYLAAIALLPTLIQILFKFPASISMLMGGTSLLILVGVDIDTMAQVEALLKMHHHDGLTKKGLKSRNL